MVDGGCVVWLCTPPCGEGGVFRHEVELLDGSAVLRTLTTSTTSVTYTAAQQLADLGALLGPGDTLPIRIFQLSALVGRGSPASVTLQF